MSYDEELWNPPEPTSRCDKCEKYYPCPCGCGWGICELDNSHVFGEDESDCWAFDNGEDD